MKKNQLLTRRQALYLGLGTFVGIGALTAEELLNSFNQNQSFADTNRSFNIAGANPLKERAAKKGLIYGTSTTKFSLSLDTQHAAAIVKDCDMLVPGWEFKWTAGSANLRPDAENFDFSQADWMFDFATTHNMSTRGHTLVWHESLPKWFKETVNKQNAQQLLEKHIERVVGRYAGKIHSWDVVNEAISVSDGLPNKLRKTPWLNSLGPEYIDLAFRLTAAADPDALLVYNEKGLDYDDQIYDQRRAAVLKLLERLKSQGTPIHALGTQAHLSPGNNKFNPEKLRQFFRDVASLGLKIMITELDVSDKYLPRDIAIRDRIVAATYEDYLSVVLDEPAVIAVITWGLSDKYTWLNEFAPRQDGKPSRPLPLDTQMQRKLAWNAIARAFDNAPKR
ncbi:MAG: endo-1,4-beta-xylanase [Sphaerospermopsis sp. SIO1G1]|nr:endo-1,4-beta-xylanase [Sphaerospermopsis sp. SIO1G1]